MPLSGSWSTVPITGTYADRNGNPVSGSVTFVAPAPVTVDGVLVVPTSFTASVVNGVLATTLPVTADPGTQYYTVLERLPYSRQPFGIVVVYGAGSVNLTSGAVGSPVQAVGPGAAVSLIAGGTVTAADSSIVVGGTSTNPTISAAAAIAAAGALAAQKASNLSDLGNAATARTNLGLGSAATQASSAFDPAGAAAAVTAASIGAATGAALASETARATAAEGLAVQKANNLSDLASASSARTNLGLGSAATQASSAFDAAGSAAAVTTTSIGAATSAALTAETTRATGVENARALIPTATKTANYTAQPGDLVMCDATSGAFTVTAPTLAAGVRWGIRLVTASANGVTASTGSGTFDTNGATTLPMATGFALVDVTFAGNAAGTQWVGTTSGKPNSYLASLFASVGALADVGLANGQALALRTFYSALADRDNNPVNVMFLGDSVTEGNGATTYLNRWQSRLASALRRRFPTAGVPGTAGGNYVPIFFASPTIAASNPWVITGSPVTASNFGIGSRYIRLTSSTPGPCTLVVTATSVDLLWAAGSVGAKFSYTVDGGSATVIDTGAGSPLVDGNKTTITLGSTPTTHTIVVTWNAGGTVNFEGAVVYALNETKGWRFYDTAHSGFTASTFQTGNGATALAGVVPNIIKPHLIVIDLGLNDQATSVTPSTFQTTLSSLVTQLIGYCTGASLHSPSILLLGNYPPNATYTYPWTQYITAMQAVASANPTNVFFFNMTTRFADQAADASLGMTYDATHPSDKGHSFVGDLIGQILMYESAPLDAVTTSTFTAVGDLPLTIAPGIVTRLPVGSNTNVLTADSSQPGGIKWGVAGSPAAHASTHDPGQSDDVLSFGAWEDGNSVETILRPFCAGTLTPAASFAYFVYFVPKFTKTITTLSALVRTAAGTGTTLARLALCTVDGSGNLALVARTASTTTLFTTANSVASAVLDATGGYTTSYSLVRGTKYAFGLLSIGAASQPTFACAALAHPNGAALVPALGTNTTSTQTDISATYAVASLTSMSSVFYGRAS